jgi:hypothetical protein
LLIRPLMMKNFWAKLETHFLKTALWCLGLTLIWVLVSIGLYVKEGSKSYFEIQAVLYFKIILVAVIFLGRYLLFGQYRHEKWLGWFWGICFLLALGGQCSVFMSERATWFYIILKVVDALIWGFFSALLLENAGGLFYFWLNITRKYGAEFRQLYRTLRQDTVSLGIILTFLAALIYYYLTSFYLLDTLFYSYLLWMFMVIIGLGFYTCVQIKLNRWIQQDIALLDLEIDHYIQWQSVKQDGEMNHKISWLHYLTLIRKYWAQMGRPKFPWQIWCSYLIFSSFILIIPYVFGLVIQVGSFK